MQAKTEAPKTKNTLNYSEFRNEASQTLRTPIFQEKAMKRLGVFPKKKHKAPNRRLCGHKSQLYKTGRVL